MINLTDRDWVEIYYALLYRRDSTCLEGESEWRGHIQDIIDTIGPDGADASELGVEANG